MLIFRKAEHDLVTCNRGHVQNTWTNEGEGVAQMTILNMSYLVKVSTWERGLKITQNSVHVVCTRPNRQSCSKSGAQDA